MIETSSWNAEFEATGRIWFRNALSDDDLQRFDAASATSGGAGRRLDDPIALCPALGADTGLAKAVAALDSAAKPVRVVAFNKSEKTNWGVPWHQDRVIAVTDRFDCEGFGNWTRKAGIWHCEPPQAILESMLFVRVHLDDNDESNGAMQIALGSHKLGIIPAGNAEAEAMKLPRELCTAKRGDVLVLKMLTLHASKPTASTDDRRVLRLDYASSVLPAPLEWTDLSAPS